MDDLIQEFILETRETLEALAGEIVAWERDPADRARLDAIFRFVHTVKGSCGFLDLPRLAKLSHAAEDGLQAVRDGRRTPDAAFVDAVLAIVDRIGELTDAIDAGRSIGSDGDEDLIAALAGQAAPVPGEAAVVESDKVGMRAPARSVRLNVDLLDRMMNGMSDLVLARNELARRIRDAGIDPTIDAALERLSSTVAELRDTVTRTRMQRIESLFAGLPRMVRDTAAELGKAVTLTIEGSDVELDREMIEMIRDPLAHILRNAIDHGIETPADRKRTGKRENGRLRVSARQVGNQIEIVVADDGRGIDTDKLVRRLVERGEITHGEAAQLSEQARRELVFRPGLSTAETVSRVSGRGVGMDVVRANVERIGGVVSLDSVIGQGLSVAIRVPLTLSIISAISVRIGGQRFAIPRSAIEEIVAADNPMLAIDTVGSAVVARLRDRPLPMLALGELLGLTDRAPGISGVVAVVSASGGSYALSADSVGDHEELVIKPAAPMVMGTGLYAGETLPDSGRPMLVLDVSGLAAAARLDFDRTAQLPEEEVDDEEDTTSSYLLFVSLDGVRRAIALVHVDRIQPVAAEDISFVAGAPHIVLDGMPAPLAGGAPVNGQGCNILQLHDGMTALAYAIDQAIDIVELSSGLTPVGTAGPVAGLALVEGEPVEVLDPFWLFAQAGVPSRAPRTCTLITDRDGWMANLLKPLIETAGYSVELAAPGAKTSGVTVALAEEEGADVAAITLRRDPRPFGASDPTLYRYDRDAVLAEIERAVAGGRG